METLITSLKISLIITALYACGWKEMIFYGLYNRAEQKIITFFNFFLSKIKVSYRVDKTICKPLFRCAICMSSFWTLFFWTLSDFSFNVAYVMLYVCGINVIIAALISNIIPDE